MSDPVSALAGASYQGFALVEDMGPTGMITLRGKGDVPARFAAALGVDVPETLGVTSKDGVSLAWMSPDEFLVICDYAGAPALAAKLEAAVAGDHALVAVVSDARAAFRLSGPNAEDVLRKLTPANMDGFGPGIMRRTRFAQVAGAFHSPVPGVFEIVCFRSVGQYMFDLLSVSAKPGSELGITG